MLLAAHRQGSLKGVWNYIDATFGALPEKGMKGDTLTEALAADCVLSRMEESVGRVNSVPLDC